MSHTSEVASETVWDEKALQTPTQVRLTHLINKVLISIRVIHM